MRTSYTPHALGVAHAANGWTKRLDVLHISPARGTCYRVQAADQPRARRDES